ncbi:trypsin-like serine peptidase [Streptomyces sp. WZ-12]|uniref:trypsin-like serine peptidase n=1 Tax=Streptomyces sp. WZ-12 TaxID=3030210 RepID=UPI002381346D|nr:trypsin-like peptidase domain-containing protein [Streptomyces sp. WZ-12]
MAVRRKKLMGAVGLALCAYALSVGLDQGLVAPASAGQDSSELVRPAGRDKVPLVSGLLGHLPLPGPARSRQEGAYWTAQRMGEALPVDVARVVRLGSDLSEALEQLSLAGVLPRTAEHFEGMPMVGTFFYDGSPVSGKATYCTGSVVHSGGHSLVLTAGHCALGLTHARHAIFVPDYHFGYSAAAQPHGFYPATRLFVDPRYRANTKQAVSDLDLAFVQVDANDRGKRLEDVTGALTFAQTPRYNNHVTVIGYPYSAAVNPAHKAVHCDVATKRLLGFRQMQMECNGFYGGVSGGPWISDYNPSTETGRVIGSVGGYNGGGNDANADNVTYSPLYGKDAQDLYNDANAGRAVLRPHSYDPATASTG